MLRLNEPREKRKREKTTACFAPKLRRLFGQSGWLRRRVKRPQIAGQRAVRKPSHGDGKKEDGDDIQ